MSTSKYMLASVAHRCFFLHHPVHEYLSTLTNAVGKNYSSLKGTEIPCSDLTGGRGQSTASTDLLNSEIIACELAFRYQRVGLNC